MSEIRVGITGGTGFIGGRLAERLLLSGGGRYSVVAAVRRFSGPGLARLARLPIQLELADLLDEEALSAAFAECDVIVHCAYGTGGTPAERRRVTVEGTRHAVRSALKGNATRFIHLSTAVVHRTDGANVVDEGTSLGSDGSPYQEMKLEAEQVVWDAWEKDGLPAVVLRPVLVHGPYGRRWTERIAREVESGALLPTGATAPANLVYVDNVVDAIIASAELDAAVGEDFILVDDDPPAWREVYEAYTRFYPDAPPIRELGRAEIEAERRRLDPGFVRGALVEPVRLAPRLVRAAVRPEGVRKRLWKIPWLAGPARLLPENVKSRIKGEARSKDEENRGASTGEYALPASDMIDMYTETVRFSSAKASERLGDWQRVDFAEAMVRIGAWLKYQRLAPRSTSGSGA